MNMVTGGNPRLHSTMPEIQQHQQSRVRFNLCFGRRNPQRRSGRETLNNSCTRANHTHVEIQARNSRDNFVNRCMSAGSNQTYALVIPGNNSLTTKPQRYLISASVIYVYLDCIQFTHFIISKRLKLEEKSCKTTNNWSRLKFTGYDLTTQPPPVQNLTPPTSCLGLTIDMILLIDSPSERPSKSMYMYEHLERMTKYVC